MLADEKDRPSDSPYVDTVMYGRTASGGTTIRPAENQWHLVATRYQGQRQFIFVGPLTTSGVVTFVEGAEIVWIRLKLGTFMPHLPTTAVRDVETLLPGASRRSFWLKGAAWEFPDYENADTFVDRLVRQGVLLRDPVVEAVLEAQTLDIPERTVRHRFLRATGLTQAHIRQVERARHAATLLRQGQSILDTVEMAGYFDQPHLTRSLRQWVGYTPAQLVRESVPACQTVQDAAPWLDYPENAVSETG